MSFTKKQNKTFPHKKGKQNQPPDKSGNTPGLYQENIFMLQRTIGNQGVGNMLKGVIQRQNTINNDGSLRESDKVSNPRIKFGKLHNGCGTEVSAILVKYDSTAGTSSTKGELPSWWIKPKKGQNWVKGHLLSELLGGPAEPRNLTPLTQRANRRHNTYVEEAAKEAFGQGHALKYHVKAVYDKGGPPREYFIGDDTDPPSEIWPHIASGLIVELKVLDSVGNELAEKSKSPVFIENTR